MHGPQNVKLFIMFRVILIINIHSPLNSPSSLFLFEVAFSVG